MYENIIVKKNCGVGTITLNRPNVLNALNKKMYSELDSALTEMELDSNVKVILLTGSGERAFSAGADISEFKDNRSQEKAVLQYDNVSKNTPSDDTYTLEVAFTGRS